MTMDPVIGYAAVAALTAIIWLGAVDKLRHFWQFEVAVAGYRLLPAALNRPFAVLFVLLELVTGVLLLSAGWRLAGAVCALAVLGIATAGVAVNLLRGRTDIDCGCGGLSSFSTGLTWWIVIRNSLLAVLALAVLVEAVGGTARAMVWLDKVTFVGVALAIIGLYYACNQLLELHMRTERMRNGA